jgi:uncharacterized protein (TIGR03067 family)
MTKRLMTMAMALVLTAVVSAQSASTKALAPLQGTWNITSINGQDLAGSGTTMTFTIEGNKYSQAVNGAVNERGTITLGADKKPMTIDLAITEGGDANKLQLGLIEVTGASMKLKLALPGQTTRPTDFAPAQDAILAVLAKKS